jgi:hypothetical protein
MVPETAEMTQDIREAKPKGAKPASPDTEV